MENVKKETSRAEFASALTRAFSRSANIQTFDREQLIEENHPYPYEHSPLSEFVDTIFGWIALNPNDPYRVDLYQKTTVLLNDAQSNGQRTLPTEHGMEALFEQLTDLSQKCIILYGNRGSGKTTVLNYFLSVYHARLTRDCRTTWFRTDVAKLWDRNIKLAPAHRFTIEEYSIAHTFFVCLKWCKKDPVLKHLSYEATAFHKFLAASIQDPTQRDQHLKAWAVVREKFNEIGKQAQRSIHTKIATKFVFQFIEDSLREEPRLYRSLYIWLLHCIRSQGIPTSGSPSSKIIQIIDGVDNIRIGTHQSEYIDFLREVMALMPGGDEMSTFEKTIILMRHDTRRDLLGMREAIALRNGTGEVVEFEVRAPDPTQVLERKIGEIRSPCKHNEEMRARTMPTYSAQAGENFIENILEFNRQLRRAGDRFAGDAGESFETTVGVYFSGNLRSYCRNVVRASEYLNRYATKASRGRPDSYKSIRDAKRYMLLEGSILGGAPYMYSNFDDSGKGRWCPNFFEHRATENSTKWCGLLIIRVLQLVNLERGRFTDESIVNILSRALHYPPGRVRDAIVVARDFGLIHVFRTVWPADSVPGESRSPLQAYAITSKGGLAVAIPFASAAVMYFMAGRTQLNLRDFDGPKRSTLLHDPNHVENRHFIRAAIVDAILMIQHINAAHTEDQESNAKSPHFQLLTEAEKSRVFSLPPSDELRADCLRLFGILARQAPKEAEALLGSVQALAG